MVENFLRVIFFGQIMAPKCTKTQKSGVIRCFSRRRRRRGKKLAIVGPFLTFWWGSMKLQNFSGPPNTSDTGPTFARIYAGARTYDGARTNRSGGHAYDGIIVELVTCVPNLTANLT